MRMCGEHVNVLGTEVSFQQMIESFSIASTVFHPAQAKKGYNVQNDDICANICFLIIGSGPTAADM